MDKIDKQDIYNRCNVLESGKNFTNTYTDLTLSTIQGQYRTIKNDVFYKFCLEDINKLTGLFYILRWQSQEGLYLDYVAECLFKIKREFDIYKLTDEEFQFACNFSASIRNCDAKNYFTFLKLFNNLFGDTISVFIDIKRKELNYYFSYKITKALIETIKNNKTIPQIIGYKTNLFCLTGMKMEILPRANNVDNILELFDKGIFGFNMSCETIPNNWEGMTFLISCDNCKVL